IQVLEEVLAKDRQQVTARQFLRNACWGRAQALDMLKRHTEAVKDWDRAMELDEGPSRRPTRFLRALSLARAGDHARAVSEAMELSQGKDVTGGMLCDLGCVCSLASGVVRPSRANEIAESGKLKEQYAACALELLRRAFSKGYKDIAHLKKDADL